MKSEKRCLVRHLNGCPGDKNVWMPTYASIQYINNSIDLLVFKYKCSIALPLLNVSNLATKSMAPLITLGNVLELITPIGIDYFYWFLRVVKLEFMRCCMYASWSQIL